MAVFIPAPAYPDVPFSPGVPVMPRAPDALVGFGSIALLFEDQFGAFDAGTDWGIFDTGGNSIVPHDSVAAFDYRQEYAISDYPVEKGGFQSYDKVAVPFDVRFRFTTFGAQAVRAEFLNTLAEAAASLNLYTATTPDALYPSANIVHYDYHREARNGGVGMLVVDVWLREVRETGTTQFAKSGTTDTAQPQKDGGTKQATDNADHETPAWRQTRADLLNENTLKVTVPQGSGANYRADIPAFVTEPGGAGPGSVNPIAPSLPFTPPRIDLVPTP